MALLCPSSKELINFSISLTARSSLPNPLGVLLCPSIRPVCLQSLLSQSMHACPSGPPTDQDDSHSWAGEPLADWRGCLLPRRAGSWPELATGDSELATNRGQSRAGGGETCWAAVAVPQE